jgi:retron-type reverse transcriptase
VLSPANAGRAFETVTDNRGAAGIDGMRTTQWRGHWHEHWEKVPSKRLAGTWTPSPVRRVEIPKPNGGVRKLGIPTVMDRFIPQMLRQGMTPIFDPLFSEPSYGFRPGRSA